MVDEVRSHELLGDGELIILAKSSDKYAQELIIGRYKKMVRMIARAYFIMGADRDDIIQEGMIGLFKAISEYRPDRQEEFSSFARLCITRQILTAIKNANRQKHKPLNTYLSLDSGASGGTAFSDNLSLPWLQNPEAIFISKEEIFYMGRHIKNSLSSYENKVLKLYLDGNSYSEIGEKTNKSEKSVNNALQRIRKKVNKILYKKEADSQ